MTIYHGGTVKYDRYGYVEFVDMQSVPVLFNDRPSFSEMVARAQEELHCLGDDDDDGITVEGVSHLSSPSNILRRMILIGVCKLVGELCEIGYEEPATMFGRGCASGVS